MTFVIRGLGAAVPLTVVQRDDTRKIAFALASPSDEQATWLPDMYENTGIISRNVCFPWDVVKDALEGTQHTGCIFLPKGTPEDRGPTTGQRMQQYAVHAGSLAAEASVKALRQAALHPSEITHLITVSCTGFYAPGFDVELIQRLRLSPSIARTQVGFMGCHGALNGLRVARSFTAVEPEAKVLLCAVELCSLHYYYGWDPQKVVANALFADGAAALVGASTCESNEEGWQATASGSCVFPNSTEAMTWTIGDYGFAMTLNKQVPQLIESHLRPWLVRWLRKCGMNVDDVQSWAVHPGGPKILHAVEIALNLRRQDTCYSREILAHHGNMSSPTVLFILQRMQRYNAPRPCVALGFGPGLTVEAALFQ